MTRAGRAKQSKHIECPGVLPVVCARIKNICPPSKNETLRIVSCNLRRRRRSRVREGVISLGDGTKHCDASCRDDVTLRND